MGGGKWVYSSVSGKAQSQEGGGGVKREKVGEGEEKGRRIQRHAKALTLHSPMRQ